MSNTPLPKVYKSLNVLRLSDVEEQETVFLWEPYIPAGAVTLIGGYGGIGKSQITCAIAADVTAGRTLPLAQVALPPQNVLIVSAEDDAGHVIKPRMRRMGANMDRVFVSEDAFILNEAGIGSLTQAMREVSATIVFMDPIVSYLGPNMDINRSNETRAMMGPLAKAAAETGCAVVVVLHIRKDGAGRSANRFMGSADFINSSRSALLADEDNDGRKFLAHVKHNWSRKGPTLGFETADEGFRWLGEVEGKTAKEVSRTPLRVTEARDFLQTVLRQGSLPAQEVNRLAQEAGISLKTLNRAKKGLAGSTRLADMTWKWYLLGQEEAPEARNSTMVEKSFPLLHGNHSPLVENAAKTITTEEIYTKLRQGSSVFKEISLAPLPDLGITEADDVAELNLETLLQNAKAKLS